MEKVTTWGWAFRLLRGLRSDSKKASEIQMAKEKACASSSGKGSAKNLVSV
jgi:hypothetical protein